MKMTERVQVPMDVVMRADLDAYSKASGVPVAELMRRAVVAQYLEKARERG